MNERIKELADQAGIYVFDDLDENHYWVFEKFAELIVRECADVAKECRDEEWFDVAGAIYEHFDMQPVTEKCIECGEPAVWVRSTQFAGDHPFCQVHAELQKDFGQSDSYGYWYQL